MTNESNPPKITLGENPEAAAERIREMMANLQEEAEKGKDECYDFTWVGKRMAKVEFAAPTDKVLRPDVEQSVNFDATENLFIAGDNLQALKLLQESYLGKVKMIYIDPPYNTGKDFVYHDNFRASNAEYAEKAGEIDEEGNRLVKNEKSNGRYHSDWLSMMYPRLKLARNLLSDDGVIFISIDDNEQANLKLLCDEVFGEENLVGTFIRRTINSGKQDSITISVYHEYLFAYTKKNELTRFNRRQKTKEERLKLYPLQDEYVSSRGRYYISQLDKSSIQYSDSLNYPITAPDGSKIYPG
ncbi:MAG: site-specific DNA-methyltransferase, partial [Prevotellaceae bacterium]|nr:site-specific DNA-methyltransferase [Prevotellaceae bacterium]